MRPLEQTLTEESSSISVSPYQIKIHEVALRPEKLVQPPGLLPALLLVSQVKGERGTRHQEGITVAYYFIRISHYLCLRSLASIPPEPQRMLSFSNKEENSIGLVEQYLISQRKLSELDGRLCALIVKLITRTLIVIDLN